MVGEKTYGIGLMSGTSLDGVDLVYACFFEENQFEILKAETIPYTLFWFDELKNISEIEKGGLRLKELDVQLGRYYGDLILAFIESNQIEKIDFIASHGHTVHHQPEKKYTLQIGSGEEILKKTGIKTVCDFRTQDVLLGGQGAPLVPVGDELLFSEYDYCLNLGGFSNVSYSENGVRKAFDICPVNTVLNHYASQLGLEYDDKGELAKGGNLHLGLLAELNSLEFYQAVAPKSLGVEFLKSEMYPILLRYELSIPDVLRTFVEHIAIQITKKIKKGEVLVTGGGAYHLFLLERMKALSSEVKLIVPNKKLIDYKEALVFALLGKLRLSGKVNCLKSVTGASKNHSAGMVFFN